MKLFKFNMPEWGEAVAASKWNTVIVWVLRVLFEYEERRTCCFSYSKADRSF